MRKQPVHICKPQSAETILRNLEITEEEVNSTRKLLADIIADEECDHYFGRDGGPNA